MLPPGTENLMMTAFQPRNNAQLEIYNLKIAARLLHYVAKHQRDYGLYIQYLIHAYTTQTKHGTGQYPFAVILLRELPTTSTLDRHKRAPTDVPADTLPCDVVGKLLCRVAKMKNTVFGQLVAAQQRYKPKFPTGYVYFKIKLCNPDVGSVSMH